MESIFGFRWHISSLGNVMNCRENRLFFTQGLVGGNFVRLQV